MATLLEKTNGSPIYPDDQAPINHLAAQKKSGRIFGCSLSQSGRTISMAAGVLSLCGFRVKLDQSETVLDLSNAAAPSSATEYGLYLRIVRANHDASFSFLYGNYGSGDDISEKDGSAYLKLARFSFGPSGITDFVDVCQTISVSGGSSGSAGFGSMLPTPRLCVIDDRSSPGASGWVVIDNFGDYASYADRYSVVFQVVRFLPYAKGRKRLNGDKAYYRKRGWVYPAKDFGCHTDLDEGLLFPHRVTFDMIASAAIATSRGSSFVYERKGTLWYIREEIIDVLFRDGNSADPNWDYVTTSTDPKFIVASRAKASEANPIYTPDTYHPRYRGNVVKLAIEARLYDGAKLIAKSDRSNAFTIRPNYALSHVTVEDVGQMFIVGVE